MRDACTDRAWDKVYELQAEVERLRREVTSQTVLLDNTAEALDRADDQITRAELGVIDSERRQAIERAEKAEAKLAKVRAWAVDADEDGEPCAETVLAILEEGQP